MEIGFDPQRLEQAQALLQRWVDADVFPGASLCVGRRGRLLPPYFCGRQRPEPLAPPLREDALFLVASITKPILTAAALKLVEQGELTLQDRVAEYVPEFAQEGKQDVRLVHLMTHTAGLPAGLPGNHDMRKAHEPFSAFVEAVCKVPLLAPPGTTVLYQSLGMIVLAEVVQRVTRTSIAEYLRREVFYPLGMNSTFLGCPPEVHERFAVIRVQPELQNADWFWNSPYWLSFGAPWSGLVMAPADLGRFCLMMLNRGQVNGGRILHPTTIRAMTANQLDSLADVSEAERRCRPWGLGWRLHWPGEPSSFGDLLGPRSYGHWGSTGALCWLDPDTETFCVLLTTEPLEKKGRLFARISNLVAAAVV